MPAPTGPALTRWGVRVSAFDSTSWMSNPAMADLASRRQWVCWRRAKRKGKETKIPYQPNGKPASTTDARTWSEMSTCFAAVVNGKFDGIGYVLTDDDGVVCIDLDHCLDKDGIVEPWAVEIVRKINSYTESSPGDGLHIWAKATVTFSGRRHENVEVYNSGRYITVTSKHWLDTPDRLEEATDAVEKLVADFPAPVTLQIVRSAENFTIDPAAEPPGLKFGALLLNDKRFKASWEHNRKDLKDQSLSSYDMSLATLAAYAEWTDQEIADLLIAHRRESGNPEKALRSDYLQRTLERARQATVVHLKDYEAAEVHRVGETREIEPREGLTELSTLLAINVTRVVQRGLDPAFYSLETDHGDIHIGGGEILLSANKARARMIEKSEIYLPKMNAKQWEKVVALIIRLHEYEEIAEGQRDQEILTWVDAYLSDKPPEQPADSKALAMAIKTGSWPIEWDEKIQVRSSDLKRFIFATMGEKPSTAAICTRLRASGWYPQKLQSREGSKVIQARVWVKHISQIAPENAPI